MRDRNTRHTCTCRSWRDGMTSRPQVIWRCGLWITDEKIMEHEVSLRQELAKFTLAHISAFPYSVGLTWRAHDDQSVRHMYQIANKRHSVAIIDSRLGNLCALTEAWAISPRSYITNIVIPSSKNDIRVALVLVRFPGSVPRSPPRTVSIVHIASPSTC